MYTHNFMILYKEKKSYHVQFLICDYSSGQAREVVEDPASLQWWRYCFLRDSKCGVLEGEHQQQSSLRRYKQIKNQVTQKIITKM